MQNKSNAEIPFDSFLHYFHSALSEHLSYRESTHASFLSCGTLTVFTILCFLTAQVCDQSEQVSGCVCSKELDLFILQNLT